MPVKPLAGLALVFLLAGCAAPAGPPKLQVRQGRHGETIYSLPPQPPSRPPRSFVTFGDGEALNVAGRLSRAGFDLSAAKAPEFRWDDGALVHEPTGVRLPKIHEGCRLTALADIDRNGKPDGFHHGALAEYACSPTGDLTYVEVVFENDVAEFKDKPLQMQLARMATTLARTDSHTSATPCVMMDYSRAPSPNRGMTAAQCGVKWRDTRDSRTYGSAVMIFGQGTAFAAFINTCAEPHCAANRPLFGRFADSFDLSGLHDGA